MAFSSRVSAGSVAVRTAQKYRVSKSTSLPLVSRRGVSNASSLVSLLVPARSNKEGIFVNTTLSPSTSTFSLVPSSIPSLFLTSVGMVVWPLLVTTTSWAIGHGIDS